MQCQVGMVRFHGFNLYKYRNINNACMQVHTHELDIPKLFPEDLGSVTLQQQLAHLKFGSWLLKTVFH